MGYAIGADPAAVHARRVERHRHTAVRAEDDRPSVARAARRLSAERRAVPTLRAPQSKAAPISPPDSLSLPGFGRHLTTNQ
jgi:hypothetical protein